MHNQYSEELKYILKNWINDEQDRINKCMKEKDKSHINN